MLKNYQADPDQTPQNVASIAYRIFDKTLNLSEKGKKLPSNLQIRKGFVRLIRVGNSINGLSNSYTMCCPPVCGDYPRALASGLSYVQGDNHGKTILYHLHQCRPCTSRDISC